MITIRSLPTRPSTRRGRHCAASTAATSRRSRCGRRRPSSSIVRFDPSPTASSGRQWPGRHGSTIAPVREGRNLTTLAVTIEQEGTVADRAGDGDTSRQPTAPRGSTRARSTCIRSKRACRCIHPRTSGTSIMPRRCSTPAASRSAAARTERLGGYVRPLEQRPIDAAWLRDGRGLVPAVLVRRARAADRRSERRLHGAHPPDARVASHPTSGSRLASTRP